MTCVNQPQQSRQPGYCDQDGRTRQAFRLWRKSGTMRSPGRSCPAELGINRAPGPASSDQSGLPVPRRREVTAPLSRVCAACADRFAEHRCADHLSHQPDVSTKLGAVPNLPKGPPPPASNAQRDRATRTRALLPPHAGSATGPGSSSRPSACAGPPAVRSRGGRPRTALQLAVRGRGWPAERAAAALLSVASDPLTRSPARVAEAGSWWTSG